MKPNESLGEIEPLKSGLNSYSFDPTTLIQQRSTDEYGESGFWSDNYHQGTTHERQHWFHFTGTSIGACLLTLRRAEDLVFDQTLETHRGDQRFESELLARSKAGLPIIQFGPHGVNRQHLSSGSDLAKLGETVQIIRLVSHLLLDSSSQWEYAYDRAKALHSALKACAYVYRYHGCGYSDPSDIGDFESISLWKNEISPAYVSQTTELTTRHIMECSSWLVEHSIFYGNLQSLDFEAVPYDTVCAMRDALTKLKADPSDRYSLCLTFCLKLWSEAAWWKPNWNDAEAVIAITSTLLCCCELALNPPLPPWGLGCAAQVSWENISPPLRFLKIVSAVSKIGLLCFMPSHDQYVLYSSTICSASGITICDNTKRVAQNPKVNWKCFSKMTRKSHENMRLSYYDYLIWVFQNMQDLRKANAHILAFSPQLRHRHPDDQTFWGLQAIIDPSNLWLHAPLYWEGNDIGRQHHISDAFLHTLTIQMIQSHMLRQAFTRNQSFDLSQHFPINLWKDNTIKENIKKGIIDYVGVNIFQDWPIITPSYPVTPKQIKKKQNKKNTPSLIYQISRQDVDTCNINNMLAFLKEVSTNPSENKRRLNFTFNGYWNDPRGLWDIEEVRVFLKTVDNIFPYWFFYLDLDKVMRGSIHGFKDGAVLIFSCLLPSFRNPSEEDVKKWLSRGFEYMNMESDRAKLNEDSQKELTDDVVTWLREMLHTKFNEGF